jgi:hypothetical protein
MISPGPAISQHQGAHRCSQANNLPHSLPGHRPTGGVRFSTLNSHLQALSSLVKEGKVHGDPSQGLLGHCLYRHQAHPSCCSHGWFLFRHSRESRDSHVPRFSPQKRCIRLSHLRQVSDVERRAGNLINHCGSEIFVGLGLRGSSLKLKFLDLHAGLGEVRGNGPGRKWRPVV